MSMTTQKTPIWITFKGSPFLTYADINKNITEQRHIWEALLDVGENKPQYPLHYFYKGKELTDQVLHTLNIQEKDTIYAMDKDDMDEADTSQQLSQETALSVKSCDTDKEQDQICEEDMNFFDEDDSEDEGDKLKLNEEEEKFFEKMSQYVSKKLKKYETVEAMPKFMQRPDLLAKFKEYKSRHDDFGTASGKVIGTTTTTPVLPTADLSKKSVEELKTENLQKRLMSLDKPKVEAPTVSPRKPFPLIRHTSVEEEATAVDTLSLSSKELIKFLMKYDWCDADQLDWKFRHLFRFWASHVDSDIDTTWDDDPNGCNLLYCAMSDETGNKMPQKLKDCDKPIDYKAKAFNEEHPFLLFYWESISHSKLQRWKKDIEWLRLQFDKQKDFKRHVKKFKDCCKELKESYNKLLLHGDICKDVEAPTFQTQSDLDKYKKKHAKEIKKLKDNYYNTLIVDSEEEEETDADVSSSSEDVIKTPSRKKVVKVVKKRKSQTKAPSSSKRTKRMSAKKKKGKVKARSHNVRQEKQLQKDLEKVFGKNKCIKDLKEIYTNPEDHYDLAMDILHWGRDFKYFMKYVKNNAENTVKQKMDRFRKLWLPHQEHYEVVEDIITDEFLRDADLGSSDIQMINVFKKCVEYIHNEEKDNDEDDDDDGDEGIATLKPKQKVITLN